ncbi:hypothetical protein DO97_01540 [Neosynechococcus sphagnicola sy1]|uniref:Glycosyltransferase subfamily 4-like N-terminal domain-containing protein n=1 Tax=Neosynechococcus sphagnicola sy1 TaxID=1497020 RepID=A0A098TLN0_9CYAN|nr:glycosyltransferase [Neosynechococcus sphagnicola]KGF73214.1 hypothetical protein DO97_01540 [Neosynechococcus sphagnicola sy1]
MQRPLRICYLAPLLGTHTRRCLNYFHQRGHEVYAWVDFQQGFRRWPLPEEVLNPPPAEKIIAPDSVAPVPGNAGALGSHQGRSRLQGLPLGVGQLLRWLYRWVSYPLTWIEPWMTLRQRQQQLRRLIAEVQPDVVHALWLWGNAFDAHLIGLRPWLVTAWGSDIREAHTLSRWDQLHLSKALGAANAVTAPSPELLQCCQQVGGRIQLAVGKLPCRGWMWPSLRLPIPRTQCYKAWGYLQGWR